MIAFVFGTAASGIFTEAETAPVDASGADLIVISSGYVNTIPTPSDSEGNTWTPLTPAGSNGSNTRKWYCLNPTTSATQTFKVVGNTGSISVVGFSGVSALDQEAAGGDANPSTTVQPGSLTPPEDDALFVTDYSTNNNTGVADAAIDSGFTVGANAPAVAGFNVGSALGYLIQGSAAAQNPTWTDPNSCHLAAGMATFLATPPASVEASLDQAVVEYDGTSPTATVDMDQGVVEFAPTPTIPITLDQCVVEYIPGAQPPPPPVPGVPGCPETLPVSAGSTGACAPPWTP